MQTVIRKLWGGVRELTQNIAGADLQGAGRRREVEEEALVEEMPGSSVQGIAVQGCLQSSEAHEKEPSSAQYRELP